MGKKIVKLYSAYCIILAIQGVSRNTNDFRKTIQQNLPLNQWIRKRIVNQIRKTFSIVLCLISNDRLAKCAKLPTGMSSANYYITIKSFFQIWIEWYEVRNRYRVFCPTLFKMKTKQKVWTLDNTPKYCILILNKPL